MHSSSVPLKQCCRKEKCCNPMGSWLPATTEYFYKDQDKRDGLGTTCKACAKAKSKQWNAENPERKREYARQYRAEHLEERRAYDRVYAKEHTKEAIERVVKWQKDNPERFREKRRRYEAAHKEQKKHREQQRRKANPEIGRLTHHRRRARQHAASGTHTIADVELQLRTQNGLCWWCGKPHGEKYEVDHRVPLARGGSDAPENLCITCQKCNREKNAKLPHEWNGRLL